MFFRCQFKGSTHFFHIRHRPADHLLRDFHPELIIWFQQYGLCFHQTLADGPVRRLPEIPTLGMFLMRTPGDQCQLHIRDHRSCQYPAVLPLHQMRQDQTLPVFIQQFLTAVCSKYQSAACRERFQQQMYLCIMTQWFKMPDTLDRIGDRFFIYNAAPAKPDIYPKTLCNQAFQNLHLDLAHDLCLDFLQLLIPYDVKLRLFLLQLFQFRKHHRRITALRQTHLTGQHRFQNWWQRLCCFPKSLSRIGLL